MKGLYDKGRQAFGNALLNWPGDDYDIILVDQDLYPLFDPAADEFLSSIPVAAIVATQPLANKTNVDGVMDADDVTFPAVSGATVEMIVIYKRVETGGVLDLAASRLVMFDQDAAGLVLTPNGQDVQCIFDNGANKIFKL